MSLVLNVEILGEFKNLTAATKGAQSSLSSLNKTTSGISKKMTAALAAIGLGFSLRTIINELEEAGKAAVEDVKSQELLALAMKNTGAATDSTIKSAEASIKSMQLSAAVADDKLRPAYQKLFIATKDVAETNKLMQIALDASAATGKDLEVVTQAMAKALTGTDTALIKLIPSLKGSKTPIDDMAKAFAGAAEKAANTDPYQRMQVLFGEMQEQIGMALLPTLDKFSTWLSTPEGQEKIQGIIDIVVSLLGKFTDLVNFAVDNKEIIIGWGGAIAAVGTAVYVVNTAMGIFTGLKGAIVATMVATGTSAEVAATKVGILGASFGWIAAVVAGLTAIVALNNQLGLGTNEGAAKTWATTPTAGATNFSGNSSIPLTGNASSFSNMAPISTGKVSTVTNNITIKGSQSAQEIASILNRSSKANGVTTIRGTL
jgi:hypothetical protein